MADRKAELEKKKAKLQAIREEKERRKKQREQRDIEEAVLRPASADHDQRRELDEMLSSLGVAPVSDVLSSLSSIASGNDHQNSSLATPENSLQSNAVASQGSASKKNKQASA
ncbi:Cytoplasmic dynein 1 intermediate chain 2 [Sarracenia purpurea var. burkii]